MRKITAYIAAAMLGGALFLAGCDRPKTISDGDMREIFREVYLSNSYVTNVRPLYQSQIDSVDLYTPILKKFGYTYDDLIYTMSNFSKRKSSRMLDIVADVAKELDLEAKAYQKQIAVLDTMDARAGRWFSRYIFEKDSIEAVRVKDTVDLRVSVPVVGGGSYEINYYYSIDSTDKNRSLKNTFNIISKNGDKRLGTTHYMSSSARNRTPYSTRVNVDADDSLMVILFGNYAKEMTRPGLHVDSLRVKYVPQRDIALDSLARRVWPFKLPKAFRDEQAKKDSVALHTDPSWAVPQRVDND